MNHRKIAELAHVSTSTVSKALSGSREISEDVAAQIRKIALDIGYFAEKNKRKAVNKCMKQAVIAVVCPEIVSIHYSQIVTLLKNFIEERDGRIAVYIYDFDINKLSDIVEYLYMNNRTDGIIVMSSEVLPKISSLPTVYFGISDSGCLYDTVGVNNQKVMDDIIDYLASLGHTEIGFIGETNTFSKQQFFENSMKKACLTVCTDYIYNIQKRFEGIGTDAAQKIIASVKRPTAFVAAYDEIAISLIHDLEKRGIYVPRDISVVGMNDIPLAPYIQASLTTVKFFYDEQASLAVDILYDKIFGENNSVQQLVVNHELVVRESTAQPK